MLTADRFDAYWAEMVRRELSDRVVPFDSAPATEAELRLFHGAEYLASARAACAGRRL